MSRGKRNAPTRIAVRMTRFATLSNISAKNALASPARNHRYLTELSFAVIEEARVGDELPVRADLRVDLAGAALPRKVPSRGVAPERVDVHDREGAVSLAGDDDL